MTSRRAGISRALREGSANDAPPSAHSSRATLEQIVRLESSNEAIQGVEIVGKRINYVIVVGQHHIIFCLYS